MIVILGPTACGKTSVATALAARIDGEIISADSRQVYRRMDIGTGKDLDDYIQGGRVVPYHLIDICEPGERYNVFRFQQDFNAAYRDITSRGKTPILCGGTGLYIEAVLKDYQFPKDENGQPIGAFPMHGHAKREEKNDLSSEKKDLSSCLPVKNPLFLSTNYTVFGLDIPRELRRERITRRLYQRLDEGMVDEIRGLIDEGVSTESLIRYGLEYKFVTEYILGLTSYDEMVTLLEHAIHQFSKRQMTWFRGMERRGIPIGWIDATLPIEENINNIMRVYEQQNTFNEP